MTPSSPDSLEAGWFGVKLLLHENNGSSDGVAVALSLLDSHTGCFSRQFVRSFGSHCALGGVIVINQCSSCASAQGLPWFCKETMHKDCACYVVLFWGSPPSSLEVESHLFPSLIWSVDSSRRHDAQALHLSTVTPAQ